MKEKNETNKNKALSPNKSLKSNLLKKNSDSDSNFESSSVSLNSSNKKDSYNLEELKHLEKALNSLINSGKEAIANKFLEGFLESKNAKSLQDYLDKMG